MTVKTVCAVYDRATMAYTAPFYVARSPEALRLFTIEVNRETKPGGEINMLNAHPEDYELHMLALFNDESGQFENALQTICRAKDVLRISGAAND